MSTKPTRRGAKRRVLTFPVLGVPDVQIAIDVDEELDKLRACAVRAGLCVQAWAEQKTIVRLRRKKGHVRISGAANLFELQLNVGTNSTPGGVYETLAHELTHQLLITKVPHEEAHNDVFRRTLHTLLKERWGFDANARQAIFQLHVYEADALLARVIDDGIASVARVKLAQRMGSRTASNPDASKRGKVNR